jgi:hypothetical protein
MISMLLVLRMTNYQQELLAQQRMDQLRRRRNESIEPKSISLVISQLKQIDQFGIWICQSKSTP